ncbi:hypothetical protein PMI30_04620 [Pseudomonas sp. GM50]|nr:hypothetical protein PMI30_04620 [Pseudomonas sp. GM50]
MAKQRVDSPKTCSHLESEQASGCLAFVWYQIIELRFLFSVSRGAEKYFLECRSSSTVLALFSAHAPETHLAHERYRGQFGGAMLRTSKGPQLEGMMLPVLHCLSSCRLLTHPRHVPNLTLSPCWKKLIMCPARPAARVNPLAAQIPDMSISFLLHSHLLSRILAGGFSIGLRNCSLAPTKTRFVRCSKLKFKKSYSTTLMR